MACMDMLSRYSVIFRSDGNCVITVCDTAMPPRAWKEDGTAITAEYYGGVFRFERIDGGWK